MLSLVRIVILHNPGSGRGRAERFAQHAAETLHAAGHEVVLSPPRPDTPTLAALLNAESLLVVAGGDGTIHRSLPALIASRAALYHLPLGTENLFAREFSMGGLARLADSLLAPRFSPIDLMRVRASGIDEPAAIMASVGPDAAVLARLSKRRRGPIHRLTYLPHILSELIGPPVAPLTIEVDGALAVDSRQGMAVVANCAMYALGLNPAPDANPADALLDLAFIEGAHPMTLLPRLARAGRAAESALRLRGRQIRITAGPGARWQADGESFPDSTNGLDLTIGVLPGAIRLLRPVQSHA